MEISTLHSVHKALFEVVKDGKFLPNHIYIAVPEGPVSLLLMRKKGSLTIGASPSLGTPPIPLKQIDIDLPARIKVGLSASNISARPFIATFEHFTIVNDLTIMPAGFGDLTP